VYRRVVAAKRSPSIQQRVASTSSSKDPMTRSP
jgi:hypothetical protein